MSPAAQSTEEFLSDARRRVDARLDFLLGSRVAAPARFVEALRYAVLGGGKRLRPVLVMAAGDASSPQPIDRDGEAAGTLLTAACAIEMIHTFSLIHDDLPSLDDDDLRRGRPTLHRKFDEATAILAGDALLNLAYEVLSDAAHSPDAARAIAVVSKAVGLEGMISGQVLDLAAQGSPVDAEMLHRIHALKTGALIAASCEVGGVLARAPEAPIQRLRDYGRELGLAFQIVDDILDVESSARELGKSPGKDAEAGKATFPAMWGIERSRTMAAERVESACAAAGALGERGRHLVAIARSALSRRA